VYLEVNSQTKFWTLAREDEVEVDILFPFFVIKFILGRLSVRLLQS
jgi:hypothetical protein